ncbi:MAG: nuclear transport factor 2 family protein [Flavobacteriaceae bacterium]
MKLPLLILGSCLFLACKEGTHTREEHKMKAEQLFRSVYGGDPSQIDSLATNDVIVTYPVFEQIFGKKAISGRESYKNFAIGFGDRWNDSQVIIHETIAENNNVVLVWSFSAKRKETTPDSSFIAGQKYSWGGITLYQFDESGKITIEIGEESSPGPFERIKK